MRIGIDGRTLQDSQYSGVSEFTLNLLTEIFKSDHVNEYQLFYNSSHDIYSKLPNFEYKNVASEKFDYPNKLLNYGLLKPFGRPFFDKMLGGCDTFYMPHMNFFGLSGKCKLVITIHDLSFLRYPEFFSWRKNFWHKQIDIGKLIKRADKIIAISDNTKKDIIELFGVSPNKVTVIHSGIDHNYYVLDIGSKNVQSIKQRYGLPDRYILYLGTIEPRKNIDGLIRAFDEVKKFDNNDLKLVIAGGNGWKLEEVKKAFEKSPYKSDIKFLGYVDQADKPAIYNLATLFVFPSFYEGFGFPPLEAMACGLPVVSSYASSLSEILGNDAIYVDPYSQSQLVGAIKEGLNNHELREKLKTAGLERSRQYAWSKTASAYIDLIQK